MVIFILIKLSLHLFKEWPKATLGLVLIPLKSKPVVGLVLNLVCSATYTGEPVIKVSGVSKSIRS